MTKKNEITFESATLRLEEIVKQLEKGNTSLDESLKLYEEGVSLVRFCNDALDSAERKIKMLINDADGNMIEQDFSEDN